MVAQKKKKIDAKQFAHDIEEGMHESALMAAYGLSPSELKRAMKKLEDRGLLKHPKPAKPAPNPVMPKQEVFECPACGGIQEGSFDECPHCGIVVSKFLGQGHSAAGPPLRNEPRIPSPLVDVTPVKERRHVGTIVGIGVIVLIVVCGFLVHRSMKRAEIQSLKHNVQAVLDASNAVNVPNYSYQAKIFGDATGAMAAVMESRRTPYSEKMHELYQKMVYLGELQKRAEWRGPGSVKGMAAYRNASRGAAAYDGVVRNELESLGESLDERRGALSGASDGPEAGEQAQTLPVVPGAPVAPAPEPEEDSTAAQFAQAQDDLRSLCAQVLNILAVQ